MTPKYLFFANFGLLASREINSCVITTAVKILMTIPIIKVSAKPLTEVVPIS